MGYFKPSSYTIENALREAARYEGIDADNRKGHVSFDLYFDDNGKLIRWEKHS